MNVALRQTMPREQFLEWEERQPVKYEFDGVRPVPMTGGRRRMPISRSISWQASMLASAASPVVRSDPVIVFEILSASTAHIDRITKNLEYRATPSIQRYVMLEQSEIGAFVFTRAGDVWISSVHGPHSMLPLTEAGIEIPIDELYEGLGFEQARPSES
jgi:Uma2 family endonuclease